MLFSVFSSIHISGDGIIFKIGEIAVGLCAIVAFIYISLELGELSKYRKEEKNNFVFKFPKKPVPSWGVLDGVLADLVYDYGLPDHEVERIVTSGIHDAVSQYRKKHPLDNPPSNNLFDTVLPYE